MRVCYMAVYDDNTKSGVSKKILSQVSSLKNLGVDITLALLARTPINSLPSYAKVHIGHFPPFKNTLEKFCYMYETANTTKELSKRFDLIYIRDLTPTPFLTYVLRMKRHAKVVFEIQSIAENEAKLLSSWLKLILCKIFYPLIIKNADGIVGVTKEITAHYSNMGKMPLEFTRTIGNGIDTRNYEIRTPPIYSGDCLQLLFVAQVAPWHGIDRLIKGLHAYKGNTNIILNIVGEGSAVPELKELVFKLGLEKQVLFHGFRSGKELDKFFDECHIAVGSLGLHRIGFSESSTLKTREYCARGIPFIASTYDSDFSKAFPYISWCKEDDSNIEISTILNFTEKAFNDKTHSLKMNQYARTKLDWKIKMEELSDFFQKNICRKGL